MTTATHAEVLAQKFVGSFSMKISIIDGVLHYGDSEQGCSKMDNALASAIMSDDAANEVACAHFDWSESSDSDEMFAATAKLIRAARFALAASV